jgi:hypothetical protein
LRHFLLTWIENGPLGFEKKISRKKTIYVPDDDDDDDDDDVSVGLQ